MIRQDMQARRGGGGSAEQGFSLVEALVALAIVASAVSGLLASAIAMVRADHAVETRRQAMLIARSVLDRSVAGDIAETGTTGEFHWTVHREPYGADGGYGITDRAPLDLLTIAVRIDDDPHTLATLVTVHARS